LKIKKDTLHQFESVVEILEEDQTNEEMNAQKDVLMGSLKIGPSNDYQDRTSVLSADYSECNFYTTHPNQSLLPQ
jgi:hypothetical protein